MRAGQSWVSHCRTGRVTWEILTGHAGRPRSGWWGTWDSRPSAVPGEPCELSWVGHPRTLFQSLVIRPSPLTSTHPLALWMNKTESILTEANSVIGTKFIMLPFTYVVMVMNTRRQMGSDKHESFFFYQYLPIEMGKSLFSHSTYLLISAFCHTKKNNL